MARRRSALRSVQKVVEECPNCGSNKPKELMEGPVSKRINPLIIVAILFVALLTCGLGLLLLIPFLTPHRELLVHCDQCGDSYPYEE